MQSLRLSATWHLFCCHLTKHITFLLSTLQACLFMGVTACRVLILLISRVARNKAGASAGDVTAMPTLGARAERMRRRDGLGAATLSGASLRADKNTFRIATSAIFAAAGREDQEASSSHEDPTSASPLFAPHLPPPLPCPHPTSPHTILNACLTFGEAGRSTFTTLHPTMVCKSSWHLSGICT